MGREVKRVPLDFDWPTGKIWAGYLNPYYEYLKDCPYCDAGYSPLARVLKELWFGHETDVWELLRTIEPSGQKNEVQKFAEYIFRQPARFGKRTPHYAHRGWNSHLDQEDVNYLLERDRLRDIKKYAEHHNIPIVAETINEWSVDGLGHDSINEMFCVRQRCELWGIDVSCEYCNGDGEMWISQSAKKLADAWERFDPPVGDGWQLWETVSEGSPASPVFVIKDELAEWMVHNRLDYESPLTIEQAGMFIDQSWSFSFGVVINPDGTGWFTDGVRAASMETEGEKTDEDRD